MLMRRWWLIITLFLSASTAVASTCYESSVLSPNPFMGNDGEIVKLADGSLWEIKSEYEYLYEYSPSVIICPDKGKLGVKGKMLNVQRLGPARPVEKEKKEEKDADWDILESKIDGDFEGWEGDTIFKLANGQIWQQIDGRYKYKYMYAPRVMIFKTEGGYQMQVNGVDGRIRLKRLK